MPAKNPPQSTLQDVFAAARNVTDRKRHEAALRETNPVHEGAPGRSTLQMALPR